MRSPSGWVLHCADSSSLKPQERPKRYTHVVVWAPGPIDLVAALQSQTDWAEVSLDTHSRVKYPADVVRAKILNGSRELPETRGFRIQLEIDEASFKRKEWPDGTMASNKLEAAESVQHFQVAVCHGHSAAGAQASFYESLIEVVVDFSLEHHVRESSVADTAAQSRHVRAGLFDAEVIAVGPDLNLILRLRLRRKPTCPCQECQAQE